MGGGGGGWGGVGGGGGVRGRGGGGGDPGGGGGVGVVDFGAFWRILWVWGGVGWKPMHVWVWGQGSLAPWVRPGT